MPSGIPFDWPCAAPWPAPGAAGVELPCMEDPAGRVRPVVVWFLRDGGDLVEVVGGRRRGRHPLEALRAPRVLLAALSPAQRERQVDDDDDEPEREQRGAGGGGAGQRLEPLRELVVAARHPVVAEQELRDEGGVEAQDDQAR